MVYFEVQCYMICRRTFFDVFYIFCLLFWYTCSLFTCTWHTLRLLSVQSRNRARWKMRMSAKGTLLKCIGLFWCPKWYREYILTPHSLVYIVTLTSQCYMMMIFFRFVVFTIFCLFGTSGQDSISNVMYELLR